MSKEKPRKVTEAAKFLEKPSQEGPKEAVVSEIETPKQEKKPALKPSEALSSEVPGKYRKFH